jgi:uncharacterized coiled-coil protein SlyX
MSTTKIVFSAIGILVGIVVIGMIINLAGMGIAFAWLPFYKFGAQLNMTQQTVNTVYDAQRCINVNASYQQFVAQVPALRDEQIPNAQTALTNYEAKLPKDETTWSIQEQQIDGELQTAVTGLQQQLARMQADYAAFIARDDTQPCLGHLPTFINLK